MTDEPVIWVCYPPPGSGLPRKRTAARSAVAARIKLGKWMRETRPEWAHAVPNYVIRRAGEPAP